MAEAVIPKWLPVRLRPDAYLAGELRGALLRHLAGAGLGPGATVLDVGCGSQPYRNDIIAAGAEYVPCDLGSGDHLEIELGRSLSLPLREFDLGISVQVLEHVWDIDEYCAHFTRHLRDNGKVILSTHGVWIYHPHPGDFRRWTREGLCRELEARGLRVEVVTPVLGPLAWSSQIRALAFCYALSRLGRIGWLMSVPLSGLMNLRMWLEDRVTPTSVTHENACVYVVTASVREQ